MFLKKNIEKKFLFKFFIVIFIVFEILKINFINKIYKKINYNCFNK